MFARTIILCLKVCEAAPSQIQELFMPKRTQQGSCDNIQKDCQNVSRLRSNAISKKSNTPTNTVRPVRGLNSESATKTTALNIETPSITSTQYPTFSSLKLDSARSYSDHLNLHRQTVNPSPRMWPAQLCVYEDRIVRVTMLRSDIPPPITILAARFLVLSTILASGLALSMDSPANAPSKAIRLRTFHNQLKLGIQHPMRRIQL